MSIIIGITLTTVAMESSSPLAMRLHWVVDVTDMYPWTTDVVRRPHIDLRLSPSIGIRRAVGGQFYQQQQQRHDIRTNNEYHSVIIVVVIIITGGRCRKEATAPKVIVAIVVVQENDYLVELESSPLVEPGMSASTTTASTESSF